MRVVLDTNVLIRANPVVSPRGLARELLLAILSGPHILLVSPAILIEVKRVLNYPRVQARWPMPAEVIERYTVLLQEVGFLVELPESFPAVVRDPDDDLVLQTAITGRADVLCSRDAAFGDPGVQEVCAQHHIRVMDDIGLLKELRAGGEG